MELKYTESTIGKKKIKQYKRIKLMYIVMFIMIAINYICLCLDAKKLVAVVVFTIIFLCAVLLIKYIRTKHLRDFVQETLSQEICVDGFIDLNIYYAKKVEKNLSNKKYNRAYNYSLLNILDAYVRKGNFEQANNIIEYLEKQELDNLSKVFLCRNKATIAFYKDDKEEFNNQYEEFKENLKQIPAKQESAIKTTLDLQKYVIENNENEVIKICDNLLNNGLLLNRIVASYYKGIILEKNKKEEYKNYYKYVVENGNDLYIANIVGKKIGVKPEIKYKVKKHITFKILTALLFLLVLFTTIFVCDFYIEDSKVKKWDTGIVNINNTEIRLPCSVDELEQKLNVQINDELIDELGYYDLYLDGKYFNVDGNIYVAGDKCIKLKINENKVEGIEVDISNYWNDELNTELGDMVSFPGEVTANSSIDDIKQTYKTGIINPAMREWSEDIEEPNSNNVKKSYGINYSGENYNIYIHCLNGKVVSISYYCK